MITFFSSSHAFSLMCAAVCIVGVYIFVGVQVGTLKQRAAEETALDTHGKYFSTVVLNQKPCE